MDLGLYPIARPPDLPLASIAMYFHLDEIFCREREMDSAGPRVSCRRMISGDSTSKSRLRASFLGELAKPLQLKERHFMKDPFSGDLL